MSRKRKAPEHMNPARREFLWKGACAALTATGITNTIYDLRAINAAAGASLSRFNTKKAAAGSGSASAIPTDYKALICIFLFGGNDGNNVLVPTDTATYAQYATPRGGAYDATNNPNTLAIPNVGQANGLLPLNPLNNDGHTYGLHPGMTEVANLFNSGKAAVLANVGTLMAPLTRTQFLNHSVAVPPQLFSHNDQQIEWQTSVEDQPPKTGWGGRCADLLYDPSDAVSMNISLAGSNTFEVGNLVNEYNVSTSGAISLNVSSGSQLQALKDVLAMNHSNLYESAFATSMNTAITNASLLTSAIAPTAAANYWTTPFPTSSLGNQLKMIARLIQARTTFGHNRQIFFASIGGFDLHSSEGSGLVTQAQYKLLADLSKCMNAMYAASVQMGVDTSVTQFTTSDFSRTFKMNTGFGADHGWGSNHMIVGGGVAGQKIYGTPTPLALGTGQDIDSGSGATGRWIPTTSVDQYAGTLAKWFGVSSGNMSTVFPYLGRFATPDLGFMG